MLSEARVRAQLWQAWAGREEGQRRRGGGLAGKGRCRCTGWAEGWNWRGARRAARWPRAQHELRQGDLAEYITMHWYTIPTAL